jgi:hypothetical protein
VIASGGFLNIFRLPMLRRHAEKTTTEQQTDAVVQAANDLKRSADDVIRAAYRLADARARERRGATQVSPEPNSSEVMGG